MLGRDRAEPTIKDMVMTLSSLIFPSASPLTAPPSLGNSLAVISSCLGKHTYFSHQGHSVASRSLHELHKPCTRDHMDRTVSHFNFIGKGRHHRKFGDEKERKDQTESPESKLLLANGASSLKIKSMSPVCFAFAFILVHKKPP